MGKKCIPGFFCIENMTLFILIIVSILVIYAFYKLYKNDSIIKKKFTENSPTQIININNNTNNDTSTFDNGIPPQNVLAGISLPPVVGVGYGDLMPVSTTRVSSISLKNGGAGDDGTSNPLYVYGERETVPINIETRPSSGYRYVQIGILERTENSRDGDVLPIMGRRVTRDKWQYYAVSNTHLNIKLPVKINGKSGSYEYGCDELMNGDNIFVVGYGNYRVTIYEGANYHYL